MDENGIPVAYARVETNSGKRLKTAGSQPKPKKKRGPKPKQPGQKTQKEEIANLKSTCQKLLEQMEELVKFKQEAVHEIEVLKEGYKAAKQIFYHTYEDVKSRQNTPALPQLSHFEIVKRRDDLLASEDSEPLKEPSPNEAEVQMILARRKAIPVLTKKTTSALAAESGLLITGVSTPALAKESNPGPAQDASLVPIQEESTFVPLQDFDPAPALDFSVAPKQDPSSALAHNHRRIPAPKHIPAPAREFIPAPAKGQNPVPVQKHNLAPTHGHNPHRYFSAPAQKSNSAPAEEYISAPEEYDPEATENLEVPLLFETQPDYLSFESVLGEEDASNRDVQREGRSSLKLRKKRRILFWQEYLYIR